MTDSLQLFLGAFAARDIADPLLSFDDSTSRVTMLAVMERRHLDIVGVRRDGEIAGWLNRDDVDDASAAVRIFAPDVVIESSSPLHLVIQNLADADPLFVRSLGQIAGVIRRDDVRKPAMRMWLFGLITVMETRVTSLIRAKSPDDGWTQYVSPGRLQKARALQEERARRDETRDLLDCLQLADKGSIIARDDELRQATRFASRRGVEQFVSALESLRNHLAHSQEVSSDWDVILELANNVRRIITGADDVATPEGV